MTVDEAILNFKIKKQAYSSKYEALKFFVEKLGKDNKFVVEFSLNLHKETEEVFEALKSLKESLELGTDLINEFEDSCKKSRATGDMIWNKDVDGIEFYALPVIRPGLDFKLKKSDGSVEIIKHYSLNQNDYRFIYEDLTKNARLLNYYF